MLPSWLRLAGKVGYKKRKPAWPYKENAHDEQVETCLESIAQQIDDAGKAEMTEAFTVEEQIVEE